MRFFPSRIKVPYFECDLSKTNLVDLVRDDLEALLDGALEGTQTSWTITYLYAIYEYYGRMVEDDCKQPKKEFDNVPDLANVSIQCV